MADEGSEDLSGVLDGEEPAPTPPPVEEAPPPPPPEEEPEPEPEPVPDSTEPPALSASPSSAGEEVAESASKSKPVSSTSVKSARFSQAAVNEQEEQAVEQEPPEPPRHIEPLGKATEETLLQEDWKVWILDKLYREGRMGRLGLSDVNAKLEDGGSTKYEDYVWQLEKFFRTVPEDMTLGNIRLKPDELLYEEERFILGKMFREINEEMGYMPKSDKPESVIDLSEAIEPPRNLSQLREPLPCFPPPSEDPSEECAGREAQPATTKVMGRSGQIFEFTFTANDGVSFVSDTGDECGPEPIPSKAQTKQMPSQMTVIPVIPVTTPSVACTSTSSKPCQSVSPSLKTLKSAPNAENGGDCSKCPPAPASGYSPQCEANIESVCKAARNAMAIYDTITGNDSFPCNLGDKMEPDGTEAGVWGWLYQLIYKIVVPEGECEKDNNQNVINSSNLGADPAKTLSKMILDSIDVDEPEPCGPTKSNWS